MLAEATSAVLGATHLADQREMQERGAQIAGVRRSSAVAGDPVYVERVTSANVAGVEHDPTAAEHPPTIAPAVGICVSGGGLRAAAFATGALQALDAELGLMRGPACARYLSAVSGGSYIAGAFTLVNAGSRVRTTGGQPFAGVADLPPDGRPFERGSPEADHLARHCRYLIEDGGVRTSLRLVGLVLAGLVTSFVLMAWLGMMVICDFTFVGRSLPSKGTPDGDLTWTQWPIGVGYFAALFIGGIGLARSRRPDSSLRPLGAFQWLLGIALAVAAAPSFAARLRSIRPLSQPSWWTDHDVAIGISLASAIVVAVLLDITRRRKAALVIPLMIASMATKLITLLAITWIGTAMLDGLERESTASFITFVAVLVAAVVVIPVPIRASPHRPYRDMLAKCFAVTRGAPTTIPTPISQIALSSLAPPAGGGPGNFPELLICAAANVSDVGASPAGTNVVPLVLTPSEMFIPDVVGASIPIAELEKLSTPARVLPGRSEPMMSLLTAIAITGAAVSPTMGRMSIKRLRQLLTMLNVRLGVWLPNPMNEKARAQVKEGKTPPASGIDLFILEFLGRHSSRSQTIYASDGGHYENLGLVELVRRRCAVIWCVDSSGGPAGSNASLAQSLLLAETVTGARIELDVDRFRSPDGARRGAPRVEHTSAIGAIHYSDGSIGELVVVKLGITEESPSAVREYQKTDHKFPHHSTANQIFRAERFVAYQRLGWDSASRAIVAWTATTPSL